MPTLKEQANALTPGDWASLRDLIREMADTVDKLKAKPGKGGNAVPDARQMSPKLSAGTDEH